MADPMSPDTTVMFPDTTVLINFAIINRMDLLARLTNGHGRWCATVSREWEDWTPRLRLVAIPWEIFGDPLRPDPAELEYARTLRTRLARPGKNPYRHLGEAETIAIVTRRGLRCFFVTDDRSAQQLARRHGVPTVDTWQLLRLGHAKGWVDADTLWGYVQTLRDHRRGGLREVTDRPSFDKWLAADPYSSWQQEESAGRNRGRHPGDAHRAAAHGKRKKSRPTAHQDRNLRNGRE